VVIKNIDIELMIVISEKISIINVNLGNKMVYP